MAGVVKVIVKRAKGGWRWYVLDYTECVAQGKEVTWIAARAEGVEACREYQEEVNT